MQEYFYLYGYSLVHYNFFEICKNASFIKYHSGLFLHIFKVCLATIEVCVFVRQLRLPHFLIYGDWKGA